MLYDRLLVTVLTCVKSSSDLSRYNAVRTYTIFYYNVTVMIMNQKKGRNLKNKLKNYTMYSSCEPMAILLLVLKSLWASGKRRPVVLGNGSWTV